jgi:hypothetical protein
MTLAVKVSILGLGLSLHLNSMLTINHRFERCLDCIFSKFCSFTARHEEANKFIM